MKKLTKNQTIKSHIAFRSIKKYKRKISSKKSLQFPFISSTISLFCNIFNTGLSRSNEPPQNSQNIPQTVLILPLLFGGHEQINSDGKYWRGDPEYDQLLT